MNCLRCGTPLSLAVCSACGFDHKTTPIMLLTQAEENSLHISRFFNIDIPSDESLSIDKRYEYGVDAFQTGDYKAALHWLQSPAKKGNHNAQFLLGQIYEMPGAFNDQSQALYWYEQAAARGNKNALAILIHHYETAPPANRLEKERYAERLKRWRSKLQELVQREEEQKLKQLRQSSTGKTSAPRKISAVQPILNTSHSTESVVPARKINAYFQYMQALEKFFLDTFSSGQKMRPLNRSQIEYFIHTNNLHTSFGITADEVNKDLQKIYAMHGIESEGVLPAPSKSDPFKSKYITSYNEYFNTLTNIYLKSGKKLLSDDEILRFIRDYDLDRRFGIRIEDVKSDLSTIESTYK